MERKQNELDDETAALGRYVDQPGQWEDVTPEDVKLEQEKAFQMFLDEVRAKQ